MVRERERCHPSRAETGVFRSEIRSALETVEPCAAPRGQLGRSGPNAARNVYSGWERYMSPRSRLVFACLWILSMLIVANFASAQARRDPPAVISGSDFGFRPEGWQGRART